MLLVRRIHYPTIPHKRCPTLLRLTVISADHVVLHKQRRLCNSTLRGCRRLLLHQGIPVPWHIILPLCFFLELDPLHRVLVQVHQQSGVNLGKNITEVVVGNQVGYLRRGSRLSQWWRRMVCASPRRIDKHTSIHSVSRFRGPPSNDFFLVFGRNQDGRRGCVNRPWVRHRRRTHAATPMATFIHRPRLASKDGKVVDNVICNSPNSLRRLRKRNLWRRRARSRCVLKKKCQRFNGCIGFVAFFLCHFGVADPRLFLQRKQDIL